MGMDMQDISSGSCLSSFGHIPRGGDAGSYGSPIFNFAGSLIFNSSFFCLSLSVSSLRKLGDTFDIGPEISLAGSISSFGTLSTFHVTMSNNTAKLFPLRNEDLLSSSFQKHFSYFPEGHQALAHSLFIPPKAHHRSGTPLQLPKPVAETCPAEWVTPFFLA